MPNTQPRKTWQYTKDFKIQAVSNSGASYMIGAMAEKLTEKKQRTTLRR